MVDEQEPEDVEPLKIKLELNFSAQLSVGDPWPTRAWVEIVSAAAQELAGAADSGGEEPARVTLAWFEEGGSKAKASRLRLTPRTKTRVETIFGRCSSASVEYSWPGVWLYIAKSSAVPGMLRMYLGIPVDPQLRHRDGAGPVVSSEVLTRVYLALASIGDATFGEVIPLPADFTLIPLTTFESCLVGALFQYESAYDIPAWLLANQDPISHSPQFLRGYGWLTLLTQALCEQLGGAAALASSGAVARVHSLPNGAVVLQATDRIEEYDSIRAELLWSTVSAVLRPGQPRMDALNETFTYMDRRPGVAPSPRPLRERVGRLIVMRDAEDGGTPDRSPAAQDS